MSRSLPGRSFIVAEHNNQVDFGLFSGYIPYRMATKTLPARRLMQYLIQTLLNKHAWNGKQLEGEVYTSLIPDHVMPPVK
ncbi:hypothetical protein [Paenibacillus arenosi]|uniref:Uncharacterized protein n=1 Tax=Paenibacillus arenosi TaxID=2774142 RepID=A0ABR9AZ41_9BACL|nr:hypothetical protein [Paenibacillus arenosi]MBD8498472.1 hypothetical protein [Paenibacillus arenosi]